MMDREESRLRQSPFVLHNRDLQAYVQDIACRLASDHCPDIRVHIVRTPQFNAAMAPNGMMQVCTGLLLRVENDAQLAGVIGHEVAHYLLRHSIERMRSVKSGAAASQFLAVFGLIGSLGSLAIIAGLLGYGRDQEREADRVGLALMHKAGYDPREMAKVWSNLLIEHKARPESEQRSTLFSTHPSGEEREAELKALAEALSGGTTNAEAWNHIIRPHRREWMAEELKRGRYDESIGLFTRMAKNLAQEADFVYARGEAYRLRAREGDLDAALADYQAAITVGREPAETHRGMGAIYRARKQAAEARVCYEQYLKLAPGAPDAAMIKSYIEELGT